jgi:general secretion pathway protein A
MFVVEDPPKQFLADDPDFAASLAALEHGLPDVEDASLARNPPPRPPAPRPPTPLPVIAEDDPAMPGPSDDFLSSDDFRSIDEPTGTTAPAVPPERPPTYATFYGLFERPFGLAASDLKFLYHSSSHEHAAQMMLAAIWRREGIVVLTGELGAGKTLLCRAVMEQLDRHTLTSFIPKPFSSAEDLLKIVLVDFGVISRAEVAAGRLARAARGELAVALRDFLTALAPLQAFAVVIIDDAQDLPADVLEQVRALADADGDGRLLQIVLVGEPSLLNTLARRELKPLADRISVRCTLGPLAADEIDDYVGHRISVAGDNPRVEFDDGAIERVYDLSRGLPRDVNVLCDRALSAGHLASASVIDKGLIDSGVEEHDAPGPTAGSLVRLAGLVVMLALLVVAGGAAAAYVLRGDVAAVVNMWQDIPAPPPAPTPLVGAPFPPPTAPTP